MNEIEMMLKIDLYVVLIILVVVFIIVGIKLIKLVNKANLTLDDTRDKLAKMDSAFELSNKFTTYVDSVSDKLIQLIISFVRGLIKKKGNDEYEED